MDDLVNATVAVCAHRDIKIGVWKTLSLLRACPNPSIRIGIEEGDALISRSRNKAATYFLKETEDEMLCFLDDDVEIDPKDFTRMMMESHVNKYPILGAAYVLKNPDKGGFAFLMKQDKGELRMGTGGGIIPAKRVSTGCMVIRREVLERMVKKETAHWCKQGYYSFFQHREMQEHAFGAWDDASEDWWFCAQALKLGIEVFLDTRPHTKHWGQFPYDWNFIKMNGEFKKYEDLKMSYDLTPPPGE